MKELNGTIVTRHSGHGVVIAMIVVCLLCGMLVIIFALSLYVSTSNHGNGAYVALNAQIGETANMDVPMDAQNSTTVPDNMPPTGLQPMTTQRPNDNKKK